MDATRRELIMQRWRVLQHELMPEVRQEVGPLTPKLEKVIHTLEWVRIEEFVESTGCGVGRPAHDRAALASAFVAKTLLGLRTTAALIERLQIDRALRRICGFAMWKRLPSESSFSRAFEEFAQGRVGERVHEALVKEHLGEALIGHLSRDATAIEAREKPRCKAKLGAKAEIQAQASVDLPSEANLEAEAPVEPTKPKRGRPRRGEVREPKLKRIARQVGQRLEPMLAELPKQCDRGTKRNAQGHSVSWNGYKLHLDTADCGVPISAILTSASLHDSQVAIPLATMSAQRVSNCYDLADAAYCDETIRVHSRSLGHVPLIDHNPRGGEKIEFAPHEAQRYQERTQAERSNARLKDEFGAKQIWVRGHEKVMSHLMFGVLALSADQLMRLLL